MQTDNPRYVLAFDCETSGLVSGKASDNPAYDAATGKEYQAIAWGCVVLDLQTFEPVSVMSAKVKLLPGMEWSDRAENVHGISRERLEAEGVDEEEFIADFCQMVLDHWGSSTPVIVMGHNVQFDLCFIRRALKRHGIDIHFSNRVIDTNTLGMICAGVSNSNALFDYCGLPPRAAHDPLEDILMTILAAKFIRDKYQLSLSIDASPF